MDFNKLQYLPVALPRFSLLAGIFLVLVAWIGVRGLRLAYSSIGLSGAVMPSHLLARPVPGVGIALPVFVPPLSAVAIALLISRWQSAALAYTGGSVGEANRSGSADLEQGASAKTASRLTLTLRSRSSDRSPGELR